MQELVSEKQSIQSLTAFLNQSSDILKSGVHIQPDIRAEAYGE
jgi:hypothetical protein